MKQVGEAVRDFTLSSSYNEEEVVTVGIATWGTVHNREGLIHPSGSFPAEYIMDEEGQGQLTCLDSNHSHFILVDDGTHGRYGVEIPLRTKLEKFISEQTKERGGMAIKIPIVCVVLEGGPGTLHTVYNAITNGTPCVVVEGSGRVADVIAQVAGLPISEITISRIQQKLSLFFQETFETFSESRIVEWTKKIQDIVRKRQLLTIFREGKDGQQDVDVAILQALLKASRSHDYFGHENWGHQLKLAVAWNRVDIARTEIFSDERQWKMQGVSLRSLHKRSPGHVSFTMDPIRDLLIWAIIQNRRELAEIIWAQSQDCIVAALACSKILKELSKEEEDTDSLEGMLVLADEYEHRAIGEFMGGGLGPRLNSSHVAPGSSSLVLLGPWHLEEPLPDAVPRSNMDLPSARGVHRVPPEGRGKSAETAHPCVGGLGEDHLPAAGPAGQGHEVRVSRRHPGLSNQGVVGPALRGQRALAGDPVYAGLPAALYQPHLLQGEEAAGQEGPAPGPCLLQRARGHLPPQHPVLLCLPVPLRLRAHGGLPAHTLVVRVPHLLLALLPGV